MITTINKQLEKKAPKETNLKDSLKKKLNAKELELLKTSFDTVGDIAILEIDKELRKKEKIIAESLLTINKNIKTVLRKSGGHSGEFRTQKLKWLSGEKRKETVHKENGVLLKLDVEKVYFSPRLSTERELIAKQVKPNEKILCLFSGCGPYPMVLLKYNKDITIVSIEKNPMGMSYQRINLELNRFGKERCKIICGDVLKEVPKLKGRFDRILMPLPKNAEDFLDVALSVSKKDTIIHFYDFLHEDNFNDAVLKIKGACDKRKIKFKVLKIRKCGQHAPRIFRICVDFRID